MRAQSLLNARQPANEHSRVLGGRSFVAVLISARKRANVY